MRKFQEAAPKQHPNRAPSLVAEWPADMLRFPDSRHAIVGPAFLCELRGNLLYPPADPMPAWPRDKRNVFFDSASGLAISSEVGAFRYSQLIYQHVVLGISLEGSCKLVVGRCHRRTMPTELFTEAVKPLLYGKNQRNIDSAVGKLQRSGIVVKYFEIPASVTTLPEFLQDDLALDITVDRYRPNCLYWLDQSGDQRSRYAHLIMQSDKAIALNKKYWAFSHFFQGVVRNDGIVGVRKFNYGSNRDGDGDLIGYALDASGNVRFLRLVGRQSNGMPSCNDFLDATVVHVFGLDALKSMYRMRELGSISELSVHGAAQRAATLLNIMEFETRYPEEGIGQRDFDRFIKGLTTYSHDAQLSVDSILKCCHPEPYEFSEGK